MPTLNINGQRVKVDDSFLSLSPDQQNATVDEIARSLGPAKVPPAPAAPSSEAEPSMGYDMLRSAGTGIRQGVEGLAGMFGDANRMQGDIASWAAGKLGASPETQQTVGNVARRASFMPMAPTTSELRGASTDVIGDVYQPKTTAGEYARTVGQFAPAAVSGPGSLARKTAMTVIPALASETAGQVTKGTAAEPYARAAGALVGGVASAGRPTVAAAKQAMPAAQSADELAAASNALYRQAEQAGVAVREPAFNRMAQNVLLAAGRINKDLRPNTAGIVDDVAAMATGRPVTLQELDELRQVVGQSMKNAQPQDVRTLERIKGVIDNFADTVKPIDVTGDIRGFEYIKEARKLWARKAKTETINDIVDKAKNQATGFENGLVIHMRALANNKKKMKSFTPDEQRMIRDVVRRGSAHGVLRAVGMLAPNSTFGGLTGLGVAGMGGMVPGALLAGTGAAAKYGAGKLTQSKVDALQKAVSTGVAPRQTGPQPVNIEALLRTLLAAKAGENSALANAPVK